MAGLTGWLCWLEEVLVFCWLVLYFDLPHTLLSQNKGATPWPLARYSGVRLTSVLAWVRWACFVLRRVWLPEQAGSGPCGLACHCEGSSRESSVKVHATRCQSLGWQCLYHVT